MKKKKYEKTANLAAEFYVASLLYRLGYVATLTLGHTKNVDIVVVNDKGETITIDVKGLKTTTTFPVIPKVARKTHFFVLVSFKNKMGNLNILPDVFVIPSLKIKAPLLKKWPSHPEVTSVDYRDLKDSKYKDAWHLLGITA